MPQQETVQELIPAWNLQFDGNPIEPAVRPFVLSVEVEQHVNGRDTFDITISAWDNESQDFQLLNEDAFQLGRSVEVLAGYGEDITPLVVGEIVAVEVEYGEEDAPMLHLIGFDKLHRLQRGRRTRTFENTRDSEVAEELARSLQLSADVEDTEVIHPHLFQYNQSDIDFLQERARRINYEIDVVEDRLVFRRRAFDRAGVEELRYRRDMKSFSLRMSSLGQAKKVVVKGWNIADKAAIVGLGEAGDERSSMDGATIGPEHVSAAFGDFDEVMVHKPVVAQSEADQIAKGIYNHMSLQFIKADGESLGNAALRAGDVVTLSAIGADYSGPYYLTSTRHVIDEDGYRTYFNCQRNAL